MDYASRETRRRHFAHIRPHRNSPESTRNSYLLISQINFSSPESHEIPWNRLRSPSAASISWTSFWHLHVFRVTSPIPNPQPEGSPLGFLGPLEVPWVPGLQLQELMTAAFQLDPKAALMMGPWSRSARWSPEVMAYWGLLLWCGTMGLDNNK